METEKDEGFDLLYGVPAIAKHLRLTTAVVYHLAASGKLPTFKIGGKVCARRKRLLAWLDEQEAPTHAQQAQAGAEVKP